MASYACTIQNTAHTTYQFVDAASSTEYKEQLRELFQRVITPIYGDQTVAINKIFAGSDRRCEFLIEQDEKVQRVAGVIVFKTIPTNEFQEFDCSNALEIKTLFVVDADKHSGKGLGTKLLDRIESSAANCSNLVVTVSETKQESLDFFKKKKFEVVGEHAKFFAREFILSKKIC